MIWTHTHHTPSVHVAPVSLMAQVYQIYIFTFPTPKLMSIVFLKSLSFPHLAFIFSYKKLKYVVKLYLKFFLVFFFC